MKDLETKRHETTDTKQLETEQHETERNGVHPETKQYETVWARTENETNQLK